MKNTHEHHSSFSRKSKHINESERQQIERWLKQKMPVREIAALLDRHRSTIYREIKRGLVDHIKSDLSTEVMYQADHAQGQHNINRGAGGPGMKLSTNSPLINEFRYQMEVRKLSPYAALKKYKRNSMFLFVNAASTTTSTCIICPSIVARCRCKEGEDEDIFPPQIGWLAITCAEQALSGARARFCLAVR